MRSKQETADAIAGILRGSGLGFEDQVKAISMARVQIQPRASQTDWRSKAKAIERPEWWDDGEVERQAIEPEKE